jgi:diguanylate cyclase (GGDEF)-like protein/PAS domain S-box-containing protein
MWKRISRMIGSLSVGRKLALIYFLDLSAVIFISGILIHEKFIAIDFSEKEKLGNLYIVEVREALFSLEANRAFRLPAQAAQAIVQAELRFGENMGSDKLSADFARALRAPGGPNAPAALATGRELLTRIGNQSNLILDPDLDTYYTMSLVVLRFPELAEILASTKQLIGQMAGLSGRELQQAQTRFLILEGRLDTTVKGIASDYAESYQAGSPALRGSLSASQARLRNAVDDVRLAGRALAGLNGAAVGAPEFAQVNLAANLALRAAWADTQQALDGMVRLRIAQFYERMWLHLGTALLILFAILCLVFFVARQIALPIRSLARVADNVRQSGDYTLRASWQSDDEIGRLVNGFNSMLAQLDSHRIAQQNLVAQASAAEAQREMAEAIPIPLLVTSIPDHRVLHANHAARDWLNGKESDPWASGMAPAAKALFFQQLSDLDVVDQFEVSWTGGARPIWALVSARRVMYQGVPAVLTTFTPIEKMKRLEKTLELWAKVFEASSEGIVVMDAQGMILTANAAFCRSTAFKPHELTGTNPRRLLAERNHDELFETLRHSATSKGSWQGELWMNRKNSEPYPVWLVMNAVRAPGGNITNYIASSLDISERKASEKQIQFLAHHDALTGLPNRFVCAERLKVSIQQARRTGEKVAVMFVDLDRFKNINDSLGHHVGDALLCSVSKRLSEIVRDSDTVSRLGGDEFVIILSEVANAENVGKFVEQRLMPALRAPHDIDAVELYISSSIGIALYPDDGDNIDNLMRHADTAMYQAKKMGRNNVQFFTPELNERVMQHLHLESDLRHAVARDELQLFYQPRIGADGLRLAGVESLIRWQHPTEGMISPASFIPLAEESGLIVPIGAWVIREACRQHAQWRDDGLGEIPVSINLSALQLRDSGLLSTLAEVLAEFAIGPGNIELELTESILMDNVPATISILNEIKALGFSLSIDDFGTGYSSLNYLYRFPIDKLKIDMSFIQNIHLAPQNLAVTKAIIGLGHTLGLDVVAEGVEHANDISVLQSMECDQFQGFYFARPMPAAQFERWLPTLGRETELIVESIKDRLDVREHCLHSASACAR